jgi:hypothetical protein
VHSSAGYMLVFLPSGAWLSCNGWVVTPSSTRLQAACTCLTWHKCDLASTAIGYVQPLVLALLHISLEDAAEAIHAHLALDGVNVPCG